MRVVDKEHDDKSRNIILGVGVNKIQNLSF